MKDNFFDYIWLFAAAILSAIYRYLHKGQVGIKLLITQMIFGTLIAFAVVPYASELMGLTFKGSIFFTVILTYFSDQALMSFFNLTIKKMDPSATLNEKEDGN